MKSLVIILLSLIFFSFDSNTEKKPPEWIHSINKSDEIFEVIGKSENKNESILTALVELSTSIEFKFLESDSNKIIKESELAFGKVKVSSTREVVKLGDSLIANERYKYVDKLNYNNGNKSILYNSFSEQIKEGEKASFIHRFEIIEKNCTLKDLIDELNRSGCNFEFYSNNDNYYTLIGYEKKRLLENIYK